MDDLGKLKYHIATKAKAEAEAEVKDEAKVKVKVKDFTFKTLSLTLIGKNDEAILSSQGLSELRKKRIMRLTAEAQRQGLLLGYDDLNALLLSSVSTLKRDISSLEKQGYVIPLRGRRKWEVRNGN